MKLRELEATFLKTLEADAILFVDTLAGANGVRFLCPKCFEEKGGREGVHSVTCWFVGVPLDRNPGPGRWAPRGHGIEDLSLVAGPVGTGSVQIFGCGWHGRITNGEATLTP